MFVLENLIVLTKSCFAGVMTIIKDRSGKVKETWQTYRIRSKRKCLQWRIVAGLGVLLCTSMLCSMKLAEINNLQSSSATIRQHSCANCGRYTKTKQCVRLPQLETAKELVDTDLEKCSVFSDTERQWMSWMFSDKSVFEIPQPQTTSKAPREIPEALRSEYTLGGRINVTKAYYKQIYAGNKKRLIKWSEQDIERIIAEIQAGKHSGMYGTSTVKDMYVTFQKYSSHLGGHGVVIGTKRPWVECAALAANNATRVTTYEYSYINSTHPRIHSVLPSEFARKYANDKDFQPFDWAASFSSIEHSGLGRYGDPLCPWGDVQAMFRVSCMLKPGGVLLCCTNYNRRRGWAHVERTPCVRRIAIPIYVREFSSYRSYQAAVRP
eukprot:751330_1